MIQIIPSIRKIMHNQNDADNSKPSALGDFCIPI